MNDNKFNSEKPSVNDENTAKPEFTDISFKKSRSVSNDHTNPADKEENKNAPDLNLEKTEKKQPETVSTAKEVSQEKPDEKKSEPEKKVVPDLNLSGIKVDPADNAEDKSVIASAKSEEKAEADVKVNQPKKKPAVKKSADILVTQALSDIKTGGTVNKTAAEKTEEKTVDNDDSEKTMVMKDASSVIKSDKKSYIKSSDIAKAPAKNKKKKKPQSGFNYSIFGGFFLAFGIVVVAFIVAIGGISLGKEYLGIDKAENDITFNIPQGSTSSDIADLLEENNIITNKFLFKVALRLNSPDTIYPGDITLQPSMGYSAIIQELATMRETYETATISFPEGVTLLDVAQTLEKEGVCKAEDFLFEFNRNQGYDFESLVTGNKEAFYHMEGYFFPDTYDFYLNDTGYNITKTVREHFSQKFTDKMMEKMQKSNLSLNEVMTLASMVQWESGSVEDMPKVASVFLNRLNDSETFPRFESDATEKYITKVIKKEADTQAELEHYVECYDTYECLGLPVGPICNPGLDAINAVLNPEKTDYYYFCNNLKTGQSFFAETLEEHEANLKKAGLA